MYFGTIGILHVKPELVDAFAAEFETQRQRRPEGGVAIVVYQSVNDPALFFMSLVAESEEAYRAISESAEQRQRFQRMMQFLEREPDWNDGYVVFSQFAQTTTP